MLTGSARRSVVEPHADTVCTWASLRAEGWTDRAVHAQLDARRWQLMGRAIVRHNGPPTRDELCAVALVNHGPRSVLTSFTAAEKFGLSGWERDEIHVAVPAGARVRPMSGVRTHWVGEWIKLPRHPVRPLHSLAPALVVAASSFRSARPACGLLAASVQQRVARPADLSEALQRAVRARHRAQLVLAVSDIAQGAQALSEIDFARLCRRHGLPRPRRQAVRIETDGRRRYLDVEWLRPDGRRVVAEVDGALHLSPRRWWDDQLRQNELAISGDLVLRFPSAVLRIEEPVVVDQLRRVLR